ncbi:serine/threonine-protein kinase [Geodermatophilus maliterrae]|uniref:non-specific serine/threonine protein kinase n=1 Tax=Geodermatophilus maliterrae TaxID=3162531 RepID=A0ABV3X8L7_9ACTN
MTVPEPGGRFGPYRVLGVLGSGGMGSVLRAHDDEHERDVALKVLHPQWATDEGYRERFRREARIAARLNEPHVVPIHRFGEIDGQLFLDMRLVEGEDLASLLRRSGRLSPARAVDVVGQVARALDAAHASGLVHRDVKPSNVLLVARADGTDLAHSAPGEDFCYLADFGIARTTEGTGPALTGTGAAVGSTEYMAPERFSSVPLDGRADVYSLACVLFETLTGRRLFPGADPVALMAAHTHEPPTPPSSLVPGVPPALDAVVLRGLAKDREQRWPTAGAMAAAARAALTGSGVPVPAEAGTRVGPAPDGVPGRVVTRQQGVPRPAGPPTTVGAGAYRAPTGPPARRLPRLPWVLAALGGVLTLVLAALLALAAVSADDASDAATGAGQRLVAAGLADDVDPADCTVQEPADGVLRQLACPAVEDGPTSTTYAAHEGDGAAAASVRRRRAPAAGPARIADRLRTQRGRTGPEWVAAGRRHQCRDRRRRRRGGGRPAGLLGRRRRRLRARLDVGRPRHLLGRRAARRG